MGLMCDSGEGGIAEAFCTIDLLPTFAKLTRASLPGNPIDGLDVWALIVDKPGATNPYEYYAFSTGPTFEGTTSDHGHWKLHVPHTYRSVEAGNDGKAGQYGESSRPATFSGSIPRWRCG